MSNFELATDALRLFNRTLWFRRYVSSTSLQLKSGSTWMLVIGIKREPRFKMMHHYHGVPVVYEFQDEATAL